MLGKFRRRLTYANVVATLALFLALGGGTTAVALQGKNTVDSGDIINQQVKSSDLQNEGVRSVDVDDSGLTGTDVGDFSLSGDDIAPESLRGFNLATDAVGDRSLAAGSVRGPELNRIHRHGGNVVTPDGGTGENGNWGSDTSTASCEAGEQLITGYGEWAGDAANETANEELVTGDIDFFYSIDSASPRVVATGLNDSGTNTHSFRAVAVCV